MTRRYAEKKEARAYAAAHGVSYQTALRAVRQARELEQVTRDRMDQAPPAQEQPPQMQEPSWS